MYEYLLVKLPSFLSFKKIVLIPLRSCVCELQPLCSSEINSKIVLWFRFCRGRINLKFKVFYLWFVTGA